MQLRSAALPVKQKGLFVPRALLVVLGIYRFSTFNGAIGSDYRPSSEHAAADNTEQRKAAKAHQDRTE